MSVVQEAQARRTVCRGCGTEVLEAAVEGGLTVLVEVCEIHPRWRCPTCWSERQRDHNIVCWRCGDTRMIGEDLDGVLGVALDEDGIAHVFICGTRERQAGESIHRAHRCGSTALAA